MEERELVKNRMLEFDSRYSLGSNSNASHDNNSN